MVINVASCLILILMSFGTVSDTADQTILLDRWQDRVAVWADLHSRG